MPRHNSLAISYATSSNRQLIDSGRISMSETTFFSHRQQRYFHVLDENYLPATKPCIGESPSCPIEIYDGDSGYHDEYRDDHHVHWSPNVEHKERHTEYQGRQYGPATIDIIHIVDDCDERDDDEVGGPFTSQPIFDLTQYHSDENESIVFVQDPQDTIRAIHPVNDFNNNPLILPSVRKKQHWSFDLRASNSQRPDPPVSGVKPILRRDSFAAPTSLENVAITSIMKRPVAGRKPGLSTREKLRKLEELRLRRKFAVGASPDASLEFQKSKDDVSPLHATFEKESTAEAIKKVSSNPMIPQFVKLTNPVIPVDISVPVLVNSGSKGPSHIFDLVVDSDTCRIQDNPCAKPRSSDDPEKLSQSQRCKVVKFLSNRSDQCAAKGGIGASDAVDLGERFQKRVVYDKFGDSVQTAGMCVKLESTLPAPLHENHVVIEIHASTVTLFDCLVRQGEFQPTPRTYDVSACPCGDIWGELPAKPPLTPGCDLVGTIVQCGSKISLEGRYRVGDYIAALVSTGGNARYISIPTSSLIAVPRSCDPAEAVTMVSVYATAYRALRIATNGLADGNFFQPDRTRSPVFSLRGKNVLVIGGMDPVGQALIQLCHKSSAARVYATVPSEQCHYARHVLNATPLPEKYEVWKQFTEGDMDVVFDGYGSAESIAAALAALIPIPKSGAVYNTNNPRPPAPPRVVVFGRNHLLDSPKQTTMDNLCSSAWGNEPSPIDDKRVAAVDVWDLLKSNPSVYKRCVAVLFQLLKFKKLKPFIGQTILLDHVAEYHTRLESNKVRGVVVCLPSKQGSFPSSDSAGLGTGSPSLEAHALSFE
jgi:NADPH:quinone reductase-like Zn-dependent oxidoreductase